MRCNHDSCNKKLKWSNEYECKCGLKFCALHRLPEQHDCGFNYKNHNNEDIIKSMKCVKEKIIKI